MGIQKKKKTVIKETEIVQGKAFKTILELPLRTTHRKTLMEAGIWLAEQRMQ